MITKITKSYVRHYTDTGQITAYVEWIDHKSNTGRTEGPWTNTHMTALIERGRREGVNPTSEIW